MEQHFYFLFFRHAVFSHLCKQCVSVPTALSGVKHQAVFEVDISHLKLVILVFSVIKGFLQNLYFFLVPAFLQSQVFKLFALPFKSFANSFLDNNVKVLKLFASSFQFIE